MRPVLAAVTALALLLLAPAAHAAKTCRPKGEVKTVVANDWVRVFQVVDQSEPELRKEFGASGFVYACRRSTNERVKLGWQGEYFPDYFWVRPVRVKGWFVAYSPGCGCRPNYYFDPRLEILDMRTRKPVFSFTHTGGSGVRDLVLKRNAAVGWIAATSPDERRQRYVVRRHDAGGTVELDAGRDIDPRSLTLDRNSVLHWVHGGQQRSAPLG